ncbi:hypothetical protein LTR86_011247, partial [Recurvomyces mirabilis]
MVFTGHWQLKAIFVAGMGATAQSSGAQNLSQLISSNSDLSSLASLLQSYPELGSSLGATTN